MGFTKTAIYTYTYTYTCAQFISAQKVWSKSQQTKILLCRRHNVCWKKDRPASVPLCPFCEFITTHLLIVLSICN